MARILLIDDMPAVRKAIASLLRSGGHVVTEAGDGKAGLEAARAGGFDLVITDMLMPKRDGTSVLMELARTPNRPKLLAISGGSGALSEMDALRLASLTADATLAKPFDNATLLQAVDRLTGAQATGG